MPKFISFYVSIVDTICEKVGRFVMYWVFFMMFLLILSFVTRNIINFPLMGIIEMAQFTITAYYLLGGGYSMLTDDHVRMDLFYGKLSITQLVMAKSFSMTTLVHQMKTISYPE